MDRDRRAFFRPREGAGPAVGAHRGGAAYAPENTLLAFANAIRLGVDLIELDVRRSADGMLFVLHDDDLACTTDGTGRLGATDAAAVRDLDAAHWFSPGQMTTSPDPDRDHPLRGTGIRIPTLEQVLALVAAAGDVAPRLCLEVKEIPTDADFDVTGERTVALLVPLVQQHDLADRVSVLSFWPPVVDATRRLLPEVVTHLLTLSTYGGTLADGLQYVVDGEHDACSPDIAAADLLSDGVATVHAAGRAVVPYTADAVADLQRMIDIEVDAVFTDVPACLLDMTGRERPGRVGPEGLERDVRACLDGREGPDS